MINSRHTQIIYPCIHCTLGHSWKKFHFSETNGKEINRSRFFVNLEVIESNPAKWQDIYQKSKCDLI